MPYVGRRSYYYCKCIYLTSERSMYLYKLGLLFGSLAHVRMFKVYV